jgi:acetoin utilization deacetylase AcuC-like enzyme
MNIIISCVERITFLRQFGVMNALPVFFSPLMVAPSESYSPSAEKPAAVVASWRRLGIPLAFHKPTPVGQETFAVSHDEHFVREVLSGARDNGFGNRSLRIAATLPHTTGAMLSAARHAKVEGGVAVAPCSGFHHAGWKTAKDFCTFNGLMVTAGALRADGLRRVGILDFDHHYGDGTDDIIEHLQASGWVRHFSAGKFYHQRAQANEFLSHLDELLGEFRDCELILYQAGADPHLDDPLGGWLSTEQLRQRDATVFEFFKRLQIPIAWNLAGGYQRDAQGSIAPVLLIHDQTLRECARVFLR